MVTPGYRIPPRRPHVRAPKTAWVAFAVGCGLDESAATRMTKARLQELEAPRHVVAHGGVDGERVVGPVEAAVLIEVAALLVEGTVPAMTALKLARQIDDSTSGTETATTARELRLTMQAVRTVGKPLSPTESGETRPASTSTTSATGTDGVVVPGARLEALRRASAGGPSQPSPRRRKSR